MQLRFAIVVLLSFFIVISHNSVAQTTDTVSTWSLSAYADVYYANYSDSVGIGKFQKFPTVSPRSNSFGLNILQFAAQYDGQKVRAMAIVHTGDIPASVWSPTFPFIQEAHAGVKLFKTLWLDAGFFKTHFGTEYLLPKDNIASSISVNTYYEPYYESGLRLNFDPTKKLEINFFLLNGYNIFEDNNRKKSLGLGVTYALGDKGNVGYTNYLGDDSPDKDSLPHLRFHNNVFFNYQLKKWKFQVGADYCFQQNADLATGSKTATMYSGIASVKYQAVPKFALYTRGEVFNDPVGFMSTIVTDKAGKVIGGIKLWGITLGAEYKPTTNSYIRLEGRFLQADESERIFWTDGSDTNVRVEAMMNMGLYFDLLKGMETKKGISD
jgi:opacity protein-like surface antigen